MDTRTYPYTAWLLTRNFQPREIELVGPGYVNSAYDRTRSGRNYEVSELFPTRKAAIAFGESKLKALASDLARRVDCLERNWAELGRHKRSRARAVAE
ncbi:hypothetical protein [Pseudomonas sp. NPDC089734]|uniref:hypothetical protein n=1 Tax=Pseudomonas sp. NPDC089734 TaxID=3364469 RepID=UPI00382F77CB